MLLSAPYNHVCMLLSAGALMTQIQDLRLNLILNAQREGASSVSHTAVTINEEVGEKPQVSKRRAEEAGLN